MAASLSMEAVVRRTGLTAHVIRVWEKRYGAVRPERTESNRRVYGEAEVERLELLRDLTKRGHSIRHVAHLPTAELRGLLADEATRAAAPVRQQQVAAAVSSASLLAEALDAVRALDARSLEATLQRGHVALGGQGLVQRLAAPLAQAVGELWRQGEITAAHEHFATAVLRTHLAQLTHRFAAGSEAPVLIMATPAGQLHEIGALLAAAIAANAGWSVTYLGANLPAAEIAGAARQHQARAVALSLVYPEDDTLLPTELRRLRECLPAATAIVAGGRAAEAYAEVLAEVGAKRVGDLPSFGVALDQLRRAPTGRAAMITPAGAGAPAGETGSKSAGT